MVDTIERKERGGSFIQKSFGFVLIRRQEGSYAGSHRAMLKDISSPRMPRPKTTNTPLLKSREREMIKRFLLKAILMGRELGSQYFLLSWNVALRPLLQCRWKVHCTRLSIVQVLTRTGENDELSYLPKGSLRHREESEGFITRAPTINYPSAKIIFIYAFWFWGGSVTKALFGWSNQGQQTNSEQKKIKIPFLGALLNHIQWQKPIDVIVHPELQ